MTIAQILEKMIAYSGGNLHDINHLICKRKNGDRKITGYDAKGITLLALPDIFYFEATDNKVFAYGQKNVYEVKEKLYQLEE